jgi:hypothetical protein
MHKAFFPLFLIALIGIVLSGFFHQTSGFLQWLGLITGLLPLIAYHLSLMRARLLSSTAIDSIYYFGFLVTIITLVTTAISIGLAETKPDLKWVLLQFALGLVATGYALFARLHLLAKSATSIEVDMVESTEKLTKNIERVVKEFDNAGFQVQAFVERTEQRLTKVEQDTIAKMDSVSASFEQKLSAAQTSFQEALNKNIEITLSKTSNTLSVATLKFSGAISSLTEEINRLQREAENISFAIASQRISDFSNEMEFSIRSITNSVHESASASSTAVSGLTTTFNKTSKLADGIAKKLNALDGIIALASSIQDADTAMTNFSLSTTEAEAALSSLSVKTANAEETLRQQITKPLENVKLEAALSDFEASFNLAANSFNAKLETLSELFPSIEAGGTSLSEKMSSVAITISKMGDAMNSSPMELNAAMVHLKLQIAAVSNAIEIALPELNAAIGSVAQQVKSFNLSRLALDLDIKPAPSPSA